MDLERFLSQSGIFDEEWYRAHVLGRGDRDALVEHYLRYGLPTGMAPNAILQALESGISPGKIIDGPDIQVDLDVEVEFLRASDLFDTSTYLRLNPDVAQAGIDPLRHFCQFGWKELRSPATGFDVWWYWSTYLDPARELINPLLHYALFRGVKHLDTRPTPGTKQHPHAIQAGRKVRRICLFAGYDADGLVDDYVVAYLSQLSRHADVYYLADCHMQPGELARLGAFTKGAWAVRHGGYDFGSYSRLARELVGWDVIGQYDELLFANDSCYLVGDLGAVFQRMEASRCDWWGMQATKRNFSQGEPVPLDTVRCDMLPELECGYVNSLHVSSYFVAYRKPVIDDAGFRRQLDSVVAQKHKSHIILKYEIGLSRYLLQRGYRFDTFVPFLHPYHPLYTSTHFDLIGAGFPFFKRLLLTDNPLGVPGLRDWKRRLLEQAPAADVQVIQRNLSRIADDEKLQRSLSYTTAPDGAGLAPPLLQGAEFQAEDARTPSHDHWWAFPVCAFDSTFAGNERAVFEQVKDDPSIKKIILTRKKRIVVDGTNVVIAPLGSPEGQYHLLRARQVFVKHSPSVNARYPLSPRLHNFINLWHGIPLKRFGWASLDMQDSLPWLRRENGACRAVVASSRIDAMAMAAAFHPLRYEDMWQTGLPRNDFILCPEHRLPADLAGQQKDLEAALEGRRLLLFCPTFKNAQPDAYYRFSDAELGYLATWLRRNNAVLGVREHMADTMRTYSMMLESMGSMDLSSRQYPNIEVLYRSASALLTDYSSCAIDFMLTGRPVISFAYDLDRYMNEERGLFYDLEHVFPGVVCRDFEQLSAALDRLFEPRGTEAMGEYDLRRKLFFRHLDDHNSWRVVKKVRELYVNA